MVFGYDRRELLQDFGLFLRFEYQRALIDLMQQLLRQCRTFIATTLDSCEYRI